MWYVPAVAGQKCASWPPSISDACHPVYLLQCPGNKARNFRRAAAETLCRLLRGDLTLVDEIQQRHADVQGTDLETFLAGPEEDLGEAMDIQEKVGHSPRRGVPTYRRLLFHLSVFSSALCPAGCSHRHSLRGGTPSCQFRAPPCHLRAPPCHL